MGGSDLFADTEVWRKIALVILLIAGIVLLGKNGLHQDQNFALLQSRRKWWSYLQELSEKHLSIISEAPLTLFLFPLLSPMNLKINVQVCSFYEKSSAQETGKLNFDTWCFWIWKDYPLPSGVSKAQIAISMGIHCSVLIHLGMLFVRSACPASNTSSRHAS